MRSTKRHKDLVFLNSGAISPLGTMTNVVNPGGISGPGAPVTFTDTDLTALVQSWINNSGTNLGLLLLNSATFTGAPAGPGDIVARYATHESRERNPAHNWDPPQLIITFGSTGLPGDYNNDTKVDAADYTVWRDNLGGSGSTLGANRDPANMGAVSVADYNSWKANFGMMAGTGASSAASQAAVPEPAALLLALAGIAVVGLKTAVRRSAGRISSSNSGWARPQR